MDIRAGIDYLFRHPLAKPLALALGLLPLALVLGGALGGTLSANPIDDVTDTTGRWTLRLILMTLSVTPLRTVFGLSGLARYRRMAGLFAFFYGSLHFLTYLWLDQFFAWGDIVSDIGKRPFIAVGFASFLLMIPLAVTSLNRVRRWMVPKRWKMLHRAVYGVAIGGVVHFLWLVKADRSEPLTYGAILMVLFASRAWISWRRRRARAAV